MKLVNKTGIIFQESSVIKRMWGLSICSIAGRAWKGALCLCSCSNHWPLGSLPTGPFCYITPKVVFSKWWCLFFMWVTHTEWISVDVASHLHTAHARALHFFLTSRPPQLPEVPNIDVSFAFFPLPIPLPPLGMLPLLSLICTSKPSSGVHQGRLLLLWLLLKPSYTYVVL